MNHIVIGAGFGDEGKGHTVAQIIESKASSGLFVVRFNGGHQAGHTVVKDDKRHVFSNFGAGSLHGVPTYWSKHCTVHPSGLIKELGVLQAQGVSPTLVIDPRCPITTPLDVAIGQEGNRHGTVGVGFGETIKRHESFYKLYAYDLLHPEVLQHKLECMEVWWYHQNFPAHEMLRFKSDINALVEWETIDIGKPLLSHLDNIIFEGAQGILLDQDLGFFPHVTRSKTTAVNALQVMEEFDLGDEFNLHFVTRIYHTRHGAGPFTDGAELLELVPNIQETNTYNPYQGEFRKAPLNVDLLNYAVEMALHELPLNARMKTQLDVTCKEHLLDPENVVVKLNGQHVRAREHGVDL